MYLSAYHYLKGSAELGRYCRGLMDDSTSDCTVGVSENVVFISNQYFSPSDPRDAPAYVRFVTDSLAGEDRARRNAFRPDSLRAVLGAVTSSRARVGIYFSAPYQRVLLGVLTAPFEPEQPYREAVRSRRSLVFALHFNDRAEVIRPVWQDMQFE